jgi:predicted nucleotidyltransferase component of viral defense system
VPFSDYRFSEDLDFSLIEKAISVDEIWQEFMQVFEFIYDESRIQLSIKSQHEHFTGSVNFYISYVGPLGGIKDVKVDITKGEKFAYALEEKRIFTEYSDLQENYALNCYSLSEIVVEKMVALMGRTLAGIYMIFGIYSLKKIWILLILYLVSKKNQSTKDTSHRHFQKKLVSNTKP